MISFPPEKQKCAAMEAIRLYKEFYHAAERLFVSYESARTALPCEIESGCNAIRFPAQLPYFANIILIIQVFIRRQPAIRKALSLFLLSLQQKCV